MANTATLWVTERVETAGHLAVTPNDKASDGDFRKRWIEVTRGGQTSRSYGLAGFHLTERRPLSKPIEAILK